MKAVDWLNSNYQSTEDKRAICDPSNEQDSSLEESLNIHSNARKQLTETVAVAVSKLSLTSSNFNDLWLIIVVVSRK